MAETESTEQLERRGGAVGIALGIAFFLLYLRTLCPTVYLGDSGEICTAIATGGIVHPPGYPLFSLLGRLALWLIPVGEPAFRIGCVTAAAAAGSLVALWALARRLGASKWAASTGAALFGASYTFWSQSTRVEVYSLHVMLFTLALLAGVAYREDGRRRDLLLAALWVSLGLAHHLTMVLIGPALAALCGPRLWREPRPGGRLIGALAVVAAGPALYLVLMFWASADPLQNWGRPVTPSLLWNHASARAYRGLLGVPEGPVLLQRLAQAGRLFADNFLWLALPLPAVGAAVLFKRRREAAAGLLIGLVTIVAYNLCYKIDDIAGYYLAAWAAAAALLAVGLDAGRAALPVAARGALLAGAASVALVGPAVVRNWEACDLSRATWVREFARNKLENVDPDGILITQGDHDTFPIWYVHDVLGVRPDVLPLDRAMCSGIWTDYERDPSGWYLYRLRGHGLDLTAEFPSDPVRRRYLGSDGFLIDLLQHSLPGRRVCMTFTSSSAPESKDGRHFLRWMGVHYNLLPQGLVLRLQPRKEPVNLATLLRRNERLWDGIDLPDLVGIRTDQDLDPDYVINHYACMLVNFGNIYQMSGDRVRAAEIYRRATEWAPGYKPAAAAFASVRGEAVVRPAS